jgi:hypothetical protein
LGKQSDIFVIEKSGYFFFKPLYFLNKGGGSEYEAASLFFNGWIGFYSSPNYNS